MTTGVVKNRNSIRQEKVWNAINLQEKSIDPWPKTLQQHGSRPHHGQADAVLQPTPLLPSESLFVCSSENYYTNSYA